MIVSSLFCISMFSIVLAQPDIPTNFTATTISQSRIDLAWVKGNYADTTYIERNQSSPWSIGQGTLIYNSTGTSYQDTMRIQNTYYYYQAWSWNQTDGFSTGFAFADNTTFANQPPLFGSPSPSNSSSNNLLSLTWSIPINDIDGDAFDWTIQCSNGQTNSNIGDTNGTKSLSLTGLTYSTMYTIWVNATDPTGSNKYTRMWYTFTTIGNVNNPPVFGTPSPSNGSINSPLSLSWNIPINDTEGNAFNWNINCSNGQMSGGTSALNGTKSLMLTGLTNFTTYKVWVNATDPAGSNQYTRKWFIFTTVGNLAPIFGSPTPSNGSTNAPSSLIWSIPINDKEGDAFNWTIQCSNGQMSVGTRALNGTKSLQLDVTNSTTYKVWVNATDPTGSRQYTKKWYTFNTSASIPPGKPNIDGPASGKVGVSYYYNFVAIDPNGDDVYYRINWGDGSNIMQWIGPYHSGQMVIVAHTFSTTGLFTIRCQAKDSYNSVSDWGQLKVTMPKGKEYIPSLFLKFIERLLERFPQISSILRQLLGY